MQELVHAELLGGMQLEETELGEARDLHCADRDVLHAVLLRVEERIGDADRHLVAELRRAVAVGVHQDVWHGADSRASSQQRAVRQVASTCTNAIPAGAGGRASAKRTDATSSAYVDSRSARSGLAMFTSTYSPCGRPVTSND